MNKPQKIKVTNLCKTFGDKKVLSGIDFDLCSSQSMVILGGSGSGKSVLLKCIMGLIIPDDGASVLIDGADTTYTPIGKRDHEMLSKIGVSFQNGALFDSLTVWENISFSYKNINKNDAMEIAREKLSIVGLYPDSLVKYPAELSGGMQKRVALARAIATNPELIFFDEPTSGLDPIMSAVIIDLIHQCSKKLGATTFTITHDMSCARKIGDQIAVLKDGKFIWRGKDIDNSQNDYVNQFVSGSYKKTSKTSQKA